MENEGASRGDSAILQSQFSINNSDYAAGFALVRAGTGEVFDFSPTPNAEVCEEWRRFGAADDRQRISLVDDAYDGYAMAEDYCLRQKEKAAKQAERERKTAERKAKAKA